MMRVLLIGAGDVAQRLLPFLTPRCQVYAVLRDAAKIAWWRNHGAVPVLADLDQKSSCRRLDGLLRTVDAVIHLAPPADTSGRDAANDPRMRRLLAFRAARSGVGILTQRWVYISTTGVYGDLGGGWADETASCAPKTLRGKRRLDAEQRLRAWGGSSARRVAILRVPGIYAADRLPLARLQAGTPVLAAADDVFTNHIHADDLARVVMAALRHGRANRIYHAVDDSPMRMADYFDAVADAFALPRPRRVSRAAAPAEISPAMLSYLAESRRLRNTRLKKELRVRLRFPTVFDGLRAATNPVSPVWSA
jgi:nucleoside-diphosphate-sugar epimerase